jgi:hypothetical protein
MEVTMAQSILSAASPAASRGTPAPLAARLASIADRIGDYIETMADYYAAAAMYEDLSRLSDAELHRRGLSRESLAHVLLATRSGAGRTD